MSPSQRSEPLIHRQALVVGSFAILLFGLLVIGTLATRGFDSLLRSDAQHYYRVATDPFGNGKAFVGAPPGAGSAYRYGRILFPLIAWVLAAGHPGWIRTTLPVAYVFGAALMCTMAAEFCVERKRPVLGLATLLAPSVWITAPLLLPEMFMTGLALLLYRAVLVGKRRTAYVLGVLLLLTRETMALALVPLVVHAVLQRRFRDAATWIATGIPLALWWIWLRVRIGIWPWRDSAIAHSPPLSLPTHGLISSVSHPGAGLFVWLASLAAIVTIGAALLAHIRHPWFPLTAGAMSLAALLIFLGKGPISLPGDAFRLMLPAEVLTLLSVLVGRFDPVARPATAESRTYA